MAKKTAEQDFKIELVAIGSISPNDSNPRVIKDDKFLKLVKSIREFPQMLKIRPIVVDANMVVLGGNMRLRACIEAGLSEVPIIKADSLTDEQKQRFIISDNVAFGEWDWDALANDWDSKDLNDWGLDVPDFETPADYSSKNKEVDVDGLETLMTISLKYEADEYWKIKEQLSKVANTPEQAVWKLLGNE